MEDEKKPAEGVEVYTFARPVSFEGTEYKEITLDFDKLSGDDILSCDRQYRAEQRGGSTFTPELDKAYQAYIVARAAGVHVGLIRSASAKDFTRLALRAQNFLLL
ncbi:phage tail assembly protein [Paenibacillus contaminans]|uniref:Phage tail assembly protein n=1 Tax=Paenibacillus contaminans TaxID=450362 RepID=A0A329MGM0_9BACL|nr:phage tail assembly protein [Paenibacillus contaminans]RAV18832.1 phage tail assembly protein [Paenibacillus contaminans]